VETSAGEPLISTRPFAVTKCSAWLVSNEYPISQAPSPVILKPATISYRTLAVVSVQAAQKKTLGVQKPSVRNIMGRRKKRAGMVNWGVQRVASETPRAPGYYSVVGYCCS